MRIRNVFFVNFPDQKSMEIQDRLWMNVRTQCLKGEFDISSMAWHRDGDYIRLTFFLEDTPEGGGGTAFLPGSHLVEAVRKNNLEKTLAMFFYREETSP